MEEGYKMDSFKFSFTDTRKENFGMAVYNTGYQKCDSRYTWGPALRDHYLVHYISAGRGTYRCGSRTFTLHAGDMFLVFPSQVVSYTADREQPWEYYWVGFNGAEAKRMIHQTGFSKENPVIRLSEAGDVKALLLDIYNARGHTPEADARMVGYLYLFLGRLIACTGTAPDPAEKQEYLPQALRFIQYNYASDIRVQDIAHYAGVSRSQLYRAFEENFDSSPLEFLQGFRINEACSLLRYPHYTIAEVANSVGFKDPLYFSRVFHRLKGVSPTAYRRSQAQKEEEKAGEDL